MAGIETSISLKDGVSPTLDKILKRFDHFEGVVEQVKGRFERLKSSVQATNTMLRELGSLVEPIPVEQEKAILQQNKLTRSINQTNTSQEKYRQSQQQSIQAAEKTKQAIEATTQSAHKTTQEAHKAAEAAEKVVIAQQKAKQATWNTWTAQEKFKQSQQKTTQEVAKTARTQESVKTQVQKTNNEKLKGVLIQQRSATETQRTARAEESVKTQAQMTNNAFQRGINILRQRLGIEQRNKTAVQQTNNAITRGKILKQQLLAITRRNKATIDQNSKAQQRFNNYVRGGVAESNRLLSNLRNALGMYVGFQSGQGVLNTADTLTTTKARLDLINDGLQTTEQFQQKIYEAAMNSRSGYAETADMVAKLATRAGKIFGSNDEAIAFTNTLQKMFHIAGASTQEMNSASLQLVQALGSGVLRGEELNAVFEAAPNVIQAIADYMNKPIGKIRELAKKGELTADIVKNAMFAAAEDVNKKFEEMPITWAQTWTLFKNKALKTFEPLLKKISAITGSKRFIGFANGLAKAMGRLAEVAEKAFDKASKFAAYLYDSWKKIKPTIYTVTTAVISFGIALSALKVSMAIYNGLSAVMIARQGMLAGATFAATVQATSFNAAVWACPITWFVTGLLAIVTVLGLVAAATYDFESANIDIWATVKKIVGNVADYIRDVLGKLRDSLSKVWGNVVEASHRAVEWVKRNWNSIIQVLGVIVGAFMWLRDSIVSVAKTIGNTLMSAMDNVTSLYNQAAQWIKDNWDDIYGVIATVVGGVLWLGEVAVIIGKTIADAFVVAFDWVSAGCAKVAQVFQDNWGTISSVIEFIGNVLFTLVDIIWAVGETLVNVAIWATNALTWIWKLIVAIGSVIIWVAELIVNNWSWISTILASAVGAIAAVFAAMASLAALIVFAIALYGIWAGVMAVATFIKSLFTIATWKAAAAATAHAAAEWLAAAPLLVKIALIGIIIGLIVLLIVKVLEWCGITVNATAMICGAVAWLAAVVINIVSGLWNSILTIFDTGINIIISIIEFFINAFGGGFDSFGDAVANLLGNIISWFLTLGQVVTKIIDAIFGTNWTAGLESLKGKVLSWGKSNTSVTLERNVLSNSLGTGRVNATDWYSGTYDAVDGFGKKVGKFTEGIGNFTDSIGDFTKGLKGNGSDALSGLGDKIGDFTKGLGNNGTGAINDVLNSLSGFEPVKNAAGGSGISDLGKALNGGYNNPALDRISNNTDAIAKNTGDTANNTSSNNDEYLNLLRAAANKEAVNRYHVTDFKVEMTNNNSMNSNMDVEEVAMVFAKQIVKAAKTYAESALSFVY